MRRVCLGLTIAWWVTVGSSCGGNDSQCTGSLSKYCSGSSCSDFAAASGAFRARVGTTDCYYLRITTCDATKFITYSRTPFDKTMLSYDANGMLLSARLESDNQQYCDNQSFDITYGAPATECEGPQSELLCDCTASLSNC